jgi:hypothetical protein
MKSQDGASCLPDLLGAALDNLSPNDRLIIVASLVCGCSDREVQRLVPRAGWSTSRRPGRTGGRTGHGIPRRIAAAFERLRMTAISMEGISEVERRRLRIAVMPISAAAYESSPIVRDLCDAHGICPHSVRTCAAPDCDAELFGRPNQLTCSELCRSRRSRHARRTGGTAHVACDNPSSPRAGGPDQD